MILYKQNGVEGYNYDDIMFELMPSGLDMVFTDWYGGKTGFIFITPAKKHIYCVYSDDYNLFIKNYGN